MKRNYIADEPEERKKDEELILERLDQVFDEGQEPLRKIYIIHRGEWIPDREHVRLDSTSIPHSYGIMTHYSTEHKYHYLTRFPALFYFETYQLTLQYRGLPLSLAEAYSLLLDRPNDLRNYHIFQQILRQGYVGLPTSISLLNERVHPEALGQPQPSTSGRSDPTSNRPSIDYSEPLMSVDVDKPIAEALKQLRQYGPRCYNNQSRTLSVIPGEDYNAFELYKRKAYTSKRPDKNRVAISKPDKVMIVIDIDHNEAISTDLIAIGSFDLMFALADPQALCYSRFESIQSDKLDRL